MCGPTKIICAALLSAICIIGAASKCASDQTYVESDCQCLQLYEEQIVWSSADSKCVAKGGSLVTIRSKEKYAAVRELVTQNSFTYNGVWIGLKYHSSTRDFRWSDTYEPVSGVSYWGTGEPDSTLTSQECVLVHRSKSWRWRDYWCSVEPYSYICEFDSKGCNESEESKMPTNIFIGIVIGSIVGFILLMIAVFLIINCVRQSLHSKKKSSSNNRVVMSDIQRREDYFNITEERNDLIESSNLPPPDYNTVVQTHADVECNDLDRFNKRRASGRLPSANLVSADSMRGRKTPRREDSVKITNSPVKPNQTSNKPQGLPRQMSSVSVEDNTMNT